MKITNNWLGAMAAGALVLPLQTSAQETNPRQPSAQEARENAGLRGEDPDRTFTAEPGDETPRNDPAARTNQQNRQVPTAREQTQSQDDQRQNTRSVRDNGNSVTLPAEFKNLGLTEEEETAMLRVIGQYDDQIQMLLDRFQDLHAQAISVEAIPLAAKMREKGEMIIVDKDRPQERTAGFRPGDANQQQTESKESSDQPAEQIKELSQQSPMAGPAAETWQKLHALHLEMVQAEAQKLVAIEKLLPEGKLEQLHKHRGELKAKSEPLDRPDLQNDNKNPEEERRDQERERQRQNDSEIQIEQDRN